MLSIMIMRIVDKAAIQQQQKVVRLTDKENLNSA